jgi:hypothetical protein
MPRSGLPANSHGCQHFGSKMIHRDEYGGQPLPGECRRQIGPPHGG